jgi:Tol biopolymer transport system component
VLLLGIGMLVLGAAIAALAVWHLKPSPAAFITRTAITLPAGYRLSTNSPPIAFSPDGSLLVYVAIHDGVQQLFVRPLDSQEAKTLPGTEGAESPFFSPDGQWIGFFAVNKLKKISISGGTALTLCDSGNNGGATWGSDDTIIFCPGPNSGLFRVAATGGKPQALTKVDRSMGENSHRWPQLLPGGKALLFSVVTGPGWDDFHIAALRLDTGERRNVLRGGNTGRFVQTGHLVYDRAGTLLAVRFDPVRLEVTSSAPVTFAEGVPRSGNLQGAEYSFSTAGSLAYIPASPRQFERRLVWVDRKGTVEPLQAPPRNYGSASLSPDGQRVAVDIFSDATELCVYDVGRGTLTRLNTEGASNSNPIWAPDGNRITYRGFRAGLRNLFWKNADGTGDEERLTTGENSQIPTSWSRDGKWLAFYDVSPTTNIDIWMLRLDGARKQQPFIQTPFIEHSAKFSPDGRWLAYLSNESGRAEVYVQPFPGPGGKWKISTEGGSAPCWARNGRELFYSYQSKMMAVDIRTGPTFTAGKPRLLFEGQFTAFEDVSPDAHRFLMIQAVEPEQPAAQINIVLNWFEELKRLVPTK